jgi:hypothetical protein
MSAPQHRPAPGPAEDLAQVLAELPPAEAGELLALGRELTHERPAAPAATAAELRDLVLRLNPPARPAKLRMLVGTWSGGGVALLALAALSLVGAGPLGG